MKRNVRENEYRYIICIMIESLLKEGVDHFRRTHPNSTCVYSSKQI